MATVPGLFLVLGFRRSKRSWSLPGVGGHMTPVTLAVLMNEAHFRLGEELGQLLIRRCGEACARRWRDAHSQWGEEGSMNGVPAQYMQLHPSDDVLEVVLSGRAGVEAAVTKLQGTKQQPLLCTQEAVLCTNLQG